MSRASLSIQSIIMKRNKKYISSNLKLISGFFLSLHRINSVDKRVTNGQRPQGLYQKKSATTVRKTIEPMGIIFGLLITMAKIKQINKSGKGNF